MSDVHRQNGEGNEAIIAWRAKAAPDSFEGDGHGIARWIAREAAGTWEACGAFEWVALGYLAVSSSLIVLFAENLAHPVRLAGVQVFVAAVILCLCRTEARSGQT